MNLVLIGYRGTGKSAVAKLLAERLQMKVISTDEEIVRRAGMSTPEIVAKMGWQYFRDLESAVAREVGALDNHVIDTGGGLIERRENIQALASNGRFIWLKATVATIVARIATDTERPPLTDGKTFTEEVAEVLERRNPIYEQTAEIAVDTDTLTPEEIADRIMEFRKSTVP
ncbi:shikimate kinase [Geotalea sp. SG265]|uniref:shikimate kinase n=1 Tax=Geotalea sp. SG265 TaxID=2922867 RepID=UPI001FB04468|nr:shikimate kinase [Geotalea sp. SG265]